MLIVIEDLHWMDALSHDLLDELARAATTCRICFVLAYRPPQIARLVAPRLESLPQFSKIELHELNTIECEQAIRAKLAQLYPARGGSVPSLLVEKLMARAQGNPFYLEELLNYLRDRGLDPRDPADLNKIELPNSLHTLILSRIDQLTEREKTTLRVASIIGRLFRAEWLTGYYLELGTAAQVKADLEQLAEMDITPLDTPEPELTYLFKHIVTHEVTYESMPFATRAQLHEQLARYLENTSTSIEVIAQHYGQSDNIAKKRDYFQKAAQAAHDVSAFTTAVDYLTRLLELTSTADPARCALALQLADAHFRLGDYVEAQMILTEAVTLTRLHSSEITLCRALYALGDVHWRLDQLGAAQAALQESLTLARRLGDLSRELFALNRLGVVYLQVDVMEAERLMHEVHQRAMAVGNRERAMIALNNLGAVADERLDHPAVRKGYFQQALALAYEIGAQQGIAIGRINVAGCDIELGDLSIARTNLREGLAQALHLGLLPLVVLALGNFAKLAHAEGRTQRALALLGLVRRHPAWNGAYQRQLDARIRKWALDPATVEAGLAKGAELDWDATIQELLNT